MQALIYIVLLLISPDIFAGIFDPPPTDKSVSLLGIIFGSNIGSIYLGGSPNPIMSALMEKFNFIIVVVGSVVVAYVGIMSTINTAQEGAVMGKKWSAIWVPMRSIAGMALMVPSPASGYSMIQVTVMWIIIQGIGAADQLWNIALDGLSSGASASAGSLTTTSPSITAGAELMTSRIMQAVICMETLYQAAKNPKNAGRWVANKGSFVKNFSEQDPNVVKTTTKAVIKGTSYFGVNDDTDPTHKDVCGSFAVTAEVNQGDYKIADASQPGAEVLFKQAQQNYDTKMLTISTMISVLKPLANGLVPQAPSTTASFKKPLPGATSANPPGYYRAAFDAYVLIMSGLIIPNLEGSSMGVDQAMKTAVTNGKNAGWISAGAYYFVFNKSLVSSIFPDANTTPTPTNFIDCNDATPSSPDSCFSKAYANTNGFEANDQKVFKTRLQTLDILTEEDDITAFSYSLAQGYAYLKADKIGSANTNNGSLGLVAESSGDPILDALLAPIKEISASAVNSMISMMGHNNGGDPLMAHAIFGRNLMIGAEVGWIGVLLASLVIDASVGFMGIMLGVSIWMLGVLAVVSGFLGALWSLGAMLAVYCPFIPFMIFTLAALGWMLTVVEAVIAGPIIALGLVTPSGDELGKLEHALVLLANIFLRPMLMIFGFLLAGRLYRAVVNLIDFGMADVFLTINASTLFSPLVVMFMYITFILSITNTCFSLIYAVPDKILRWIGGGPEQTDASAGKQVEAGAKSASSEVGKQGGDGASAAGNKAAKSRQNKHDKK